MHYHFGLLNCLKLAVLLFQQMSGWLKSPSRTRPCNSSLPVAEGRRLYQQVLLDQGACSRQHLQSSLLLAAIRGQLFTLSSLMQRETLPVLPHLSLLNSL